jgi:hypothetical protein
MSTTHPPTETRPGPSLSTEFHGPIDFVLIEFSPDRLTGEVAPALQDLVDRGVVRLLDLMVISKADDGTVTSVDFSDTARIGPGFAAFTGARSGLISEDDMREAAGAMRAGTVAALLVYENSWAVPFVGAVASSGGELIASARIPAPVVMAVLDALESQS